MVIIDPSKWRSQPLGKPTAEPRACPRCGKGGLRRAWDIWGNPHLWEPGEGAHECEKADE
jgi:hypothetical protein